MINVNVCATYWLRKYITSQVTVKANTRVIVTKKKKKMCYYWKWLATLHNTNMANSPWHCRLWNELWLERACVVPHTYFISSHLVKNTGSSLFQKLCNPDQPSIQFSYIPPFKLSFSRVLLTQSSFFFVKAFNKTVVRKYNQSCAHTAHVDHRFWPLLIKPFSFN